MYLTGQISFSIHLIYLIKKIYTQWGKSQSMKPKNSKFCFDLFVCFGVFIFFVPMSSSQNWEIVKTHITGKLTDNRNLFKIPHTGVIFEIFFFVFKAGQGRAIFLNDPDLEYLTRLRHIDLSFYDKAELNAFYKCANPGMICS